MVLGSEDRHESGMTIVMYICFIWKEFYPELLFLLRFENWMLIL